MREHVFRLTRGQDLKEEIVRYVKEHEIDAGVILSGVGCVYQACFRRADGKSIHREETEFEIVALQGTVSRNGCHIHIALSDDSLRTIGGHLMEGCLINTTSEIVLLELSDWKFERKFDEKTGYDELFPQPGSNQM